jgi:hypothetical protein
MRLPGLGHSSATRAPGCWDDPTAIDRGVGQPNLDVARRDALGDSPGGVRDAFAVVARFGCEDDPDDYPACRGRGNR